MDMSDVIVLLVTGTTTDNSGTQRVTITQRRSVFCRIGSVGMKESYQALAIGHNPELKVKIAEFSDYNGEVFALYSGVVYKVLRTYRTGVSIELTLERTSDLEDVI